MRWITIYVTGQFVILNLAENCNQHSVMQKLKEAAMQHHGVFVFIGRQLALNTVTSVKNRSLPCAPPHQHGQALGCVEPQPWTCNFVHLLQGFRGYQWYPPLLQMVPGAFCTQLFNDDRNGQLSMMKFSFSTFSTRSPCLGYRLAVNNSRGSAHPTSQSRQYLARSPSDVKL